MCFARQFALATALTGSLTLLAAPSRATPPEIPPYHAQILDTQPIRRTYYALSDHPVQIRAGSLLVYRDDLIPSNDQTALRGVVRLDPSRPPDATNPELRGNFDLLRPFEDYDVIQPWGSLSTLHVLQLSRPLQPQEILGVVYVDELPEEPVAVGDPDSSRGPIGPSGREKGKVVCGSRRGSTSMSSRPAGIGIPGRWSSPADLAGV